MLLTSPQDTERGYRLLIILDKFQSLLRDLECWFRKTLQRDPTQTMIF